MLSILRDRDKIFLTDQIMRQVIVSLSHHNTLGYCDGNMGSYDIIT